MNWLLLLTGLMIIVTTFTIVFSFNFDYSKSSRIKLTIIGIVLLIFTIYLIYFVLSHPLLGL